VGGFVQTSMDSLSWKKSLLKDLGWNLHTHADGANIIANGAIIVMRYRDVVEVIVETRYLSFFSMVKILLYSGVLI